MSAAHIKIVREITLIPTGGIIFSMGVPVNFLNGIEKITIDIM